MTAADASKFEDSQAGVIRENKLKGEQEDGKGDYHPSRLATSQALRHKHEHLEAITHLTHQFGGKVLDISTNNCIFEM